MDESGQENSTSNVQPGETFAYIREQNVPLVKEAEEALATSGVEKGTPELRITRKRIARGFKEREKKSMTDQKTGLLNEYGFKIRVQQEIERARRMRRETGGSLEGPRGKMVLVLLDINDLKKVNDLEGHQAGDRLIMGTAEVLRGNTRIYEPVGRIGGDEYAVLLVNTDYEKAKAYWERVNSGFEHYSYEEGEERKGLPLSVSTGMIELDTRNWDESFRLADTAMYKSKEETKRRGKNVLKTAEDLTTQEILEGPKALQNGV